MRVIPGLCFLDTRPRLKHQPFRFRRTPHPPKAGEEDTLACSRRARA